MRPIHRFGRCAIGAALLLVAAVSCDRSSSAPLLPPAPSWIEVVPTTLVVDGLELRLDVYAWRDFMPVAPPDGDPLSAALELRTTSGDPLPSGLALDAAWVVFKGHVWASVPKATGAQHGPDVIEYVVSGGPKWGPGVEVDVAVRVTGPPGGPVLIAARHVIVERTD